MAQQPANLPTPLDVTRGVLDYFLRTRSNLTDQQIRNLTPAQRANYESQLGTKKLATYNTLNDNELRRIFNQVLPSNRHAVFAINYDIDPNLFAQWVSGQIPSIASRRSVIYFLITGIRTTNVVAKTTVQNLQWMNYNASTFIYADGDNILFAAIPLFPFAAVWTGRVQACLFYRSRTYPAFTAALQEIHELGISNATPLSIVSSYGTLKDAADISLSTTVTYTVPRLGVNGDRKNLFIVTNDRIANEIALTARDLITLNQMAGHTVTILDPRAETQQWDVKIPQFEDEDNDASGYTEWFINFIRNNTFPVPLNYQEIVEIIRSSQNNRDIYRGIMQYNDIRGYSLYQQYMVITGQKFVISQDLEAYLGRIGRLNWRDPVQNSNLIPLGPVTHSFLSPNLQYQGYRLNQTDLVQLNSEIVPEVLFWLYRVFTWAEAIQNQTIRMALGVVNYTVQNGVITDLIFIRAS